jgi:RHS repeat-associated protein
VNRLVTAETASTYATSPAHCWGEAYVYDNSTNSPGEFGNLTNINVASTSYNGCTQESLSLVANTKNQMTSFSYDASGNVTNDGTHGYAWFADGHLGSASGVSYFYDVRGDRIVKGGNVHKWYWYGLGSQVLDESDTSGNITDEYVYFGDQRVAHRVVSSNSIYFYGSDMLGTSRTIFTSAGVLCYDADFYPFGGERAYTNTCTQNYKFEGKERDSETNNDDFDARYYSSQFGRWISPDWSSVPVPVPYANLTNPQTLNLYAMVSDNPETFADLDGHCCDLSDVINFVTGAANAYGSDNLGGVGRQQQDTSAGRFGQAVGDAIATFDGAEKMVTGGSVVAASVPADATGAGALVGVPAAAAGLVVAGQGTIEAGTGAGNLLKSALGPKAGESGGPGAGKDFTDKTKQQAIQENKTANGGEAKCVYCGEKVGEGTGNKTNIDHSKAKANGGTNGLNNANVTCEYCNKSKGTGDAPKNPKQPPQS